MSLIWTLPSLSLTNFQYADNEDARQYDRRLRGPVDERRELAINPETGAQALNQWPFLTLAKNAQVSKITLLQKTLA